VKPEGESHADFDDRVWRERLHVDNEGRVFIPPMALKKGLEATAKYLAEKIPGEGKATWTKHFKQGIMVLDPLIIPGVDPAKVQGERLYVPSDGKSGSGSRVWRTFPTIPEWKTEAIIYVADPKLIKKIDKIKEFLDHMGLFNGFGRFAPRVGGFYGRFVVEKFEASEFDASKIEELAA
jgi:hypothetical protein